MNEDIPIEKERPGHAASQTQAISSLEKERTQLLQQLAEKENVIRIKNEEIRAKNQQLEEQKKVIAELKEKISHLQQGAEFKLKLQLQARRDAPEGMYRGAAVADGNVMYCISYKSYTVYRYHLDDDAWQEHSRCPCRNPGLAIIKDLLTTVGGREETHNEAKKELRKTNRLASWRNGKWECVFRPMNIARWDHAVVSDSRYVLAAGGNDDESETSVELFTVSSETWSTVRDLPVSFSRITATLCDGRIYAMDKYGCAYSILLSDLAREMSSQPSWLPLKSVLPIHSATLCAVGGVVVAVGGLRDEMADKNIYAYHGNEDSGKWEQIGCMDTPRFWAMVALLPGDKMVVVGGRTQEKLSPISLHTTVEVAVVR